MGGTSGRGGREAPELEVMLVGSTAASGTCSIPRSWRWSRGWSSILISWEHLSPHPLLTQATQTGCQEVVLPLRTAFPGRERHGEPSRDTEGSCLG